MQQLVTLFTLCVLTLLLPGKCSRILFVSPSPSISHSVIYHPIIRELSSRGHQVVSIISDVMNDPTLDNLTEIDIGHITYPYWKNRSGHLVMDYNGKTKVFQAVNFHNEFIELCDLLMAEPHVNRLIKDPQEHFDVVIVEWLTFSATAAFGVRFRCPVIGISSFSIFLNGNDDVGNPTHPIYSLDAWQNMVDANSFWDRLHSTLEAIIFRMYYYFLLQPKHDRIAKKHFGASIPYINEIEKNVSLILQNTNPIFHRKGPLVPAVIEFGGIHMRNRKPLPNEWQEYLDKSTNGCIYFSLGTNVRSDQLPPGTIQMMLNVFRNLPYNVLWKFETDVKFDNVSNVRLSKWFPQQDILDHKNTKLFITQGGLQSAEEAIRSKVPLLAIPFIADQHQNARRFKELGIGKYLVADQITKETFDTAIRTIINTKSYYENVAAVSDVLWDTPMKPLDTVVWWVEYVIRHRGATHLRSPSADLSWNQYLLLDVVAFLIFCIICEMYLIYRCAKLISILIFKSNIRIKYKSS